MFQPIKVTKLCALNYKTFTTPLELNIHESGVVFVRSKNITKKTTSGCGKTSLLSIFGYVLGYGPPTTEVLSWNKENVFAELTVELNSISYTIRRSNGIPGLKISGPDLKLDGKAADDWLRRNIGDPKIASAATWRKQKTEGNFFSMQPGKKREFLTKLLALELFEEESKKANILSEKINTNLLSRIAEYKECDLNFKKLLNSLPEEPSNDKISSYEEELQLLYNQKNALEELYNSKLNKNNYEDIRKQELEYDSLIKEIDSDILIVRQELSKAYDIQRSNLEKKCNVCGTILQEGKNITVDIDTPKNKLQELEEIKKTLQIELRSLKESERKNTEKCFDIQKDIKNIDSKISNVQKLKSVEETRINEYEISMRNYIVLLEDNELRLNQLKNTIDNLTIERNREKDFADFIGKDFISDYLASALQEITTITNQFLTRIPNVSNCSIVFEPVDKGEKREITTRIFVDGIERTGEPLSGGQFSSVELACDLALNVVIKNRKLCQLPWMILDEPFEGLGSIDKEAYIDLLNEIGGTFYIVDQSRDFSELFATQGIGIEFDGVSAQLVSETTRNNW